MQSSTQPVRRQMQPSGGGSQKPITFIPIGAAGSGKSTVMNSLVGE